jgi:hypothetical protein
MAPWALVPIARFPLTFMSTATPRRRAGKMLMSAWKLAVSPPCEMRGSPEERTAQPIA